MITLHSGYRALDPCVHCGFCLPACPTYLATGDENDSPRGRIVLMRALEEGDLRPTDPSLRAHLDACLGCRGCEPACPSGVAYGRGLESARHDLARANGLPLHLRFLLTAFRVRWLWRVLFHLARSLRRCARLVPARTTRMLASTAPVHPQGLAISRFPRPPGSPPPVSARHSRTSTALLFRGCVMHALFDHVHAATRRVLEANGYRVVEAPTWVCCGALHEHAGDVKGAQRLARQNIAALDGKADWVVVNSAGCGAMLKDYDRLLGTDEAARLASRVRDVTELLAAAGPRTGAVLDLDVAYDPPCHLQHAQGVHTEVLATLHAIPGLRVQLLPMHDHCCGGAGLYTLLHPKLSDAVLAPKIASIRDADPRPTVVATGNPGCIMQIGAGLRAAGLSIPVLHPIELLDWSYRRLASR
jgi:glycolate oxidase iron-sulfur subunit